MLSSYGKGIVIAIALTGVVATTSCSGQTMRERWQQRMAERRANGGQQQGMQTFAQSVGMRLNEGRLALQKDASAGHWG